MSGKLLFSAFIFFHFINFAEVPAITIAENGESRYTIVISREASPAELYASDELQNYLKIMSDAYIPISRDNEIISGPMIMVGQSAALEKLGVEVNSGDLGGEGFMLKTSGEHLVIAGSRNRGTLYGVYSFLEKLGCRWYSSEATKIPSFTRLEVSPLDEIDTPAFAYREPFWFDALRGEWCARNKVNSSYGDITGKQGGKFKYWGGHNFHYLVPPEEYFEDHPEYYSFVNGKRVWEYAQLCLTNPELMRITVVRLLSMMRSDPSNDVYEVSQMDWANWCVCGLCSHLDEVEESHAATAVNFANLIADRVKRDFPDKLIGTFAYRYTEKAPKTLQARENVCIRLCNIIGCDAHPLTDCPQNISWFTTNMRNWNKLAKNIVIWDYVTNFANYLMPFPNWQATWKDLQFFGKNNVIGVFEEGAYESEASAGAEIEAYLQAKNLWNPGLDYSILLNDFLEGYYHAAAPGVRKYMDCIQKKVNDGNIHFNLYSTPLIELFSPANILEYEGCLDEADALARGDAVAAYRVDEIRLGLRYVKLAQPLRHFVDGNIYRVDPSAPAYANLSELNDFIEDCRMHEVTHLREHTPFETIVAMLRANVSNHEIVALENPFLEIKVIPSLGGRIYSIVDKKTNKNVLRIPTEKEWPYPSVGGYSEGPVWQEAFSHDIRKSAEANAITMGTKISYRSDLDAFRVTRTILLPPDKKEIRISTVLECLKQVSRPVGISPTLDLALGDWKDVRGYIRTGGKEYAARQLSEIRDELRQTTSISASFHNREVEGGEWIIANESTNTGVLNRFTPDELNSLGISADPSTGSTRMSLSGRQRVMKPGDKVFLSHTIIPIDDIAAYLK